MFEIQVDTLRNRLSITLRGFASLNNVTKFARELEDAVTRLQKGAIAHQVLYDVSGANIQSQAVVAALRELARRSRKTADFAMINASALAGRQLRRIFAGLDVLVFEDRAAAIAWLDERLDMVAR